MATAIEDLLLQLKKVDELCAPSQASANNYQALLKELYDGASETCRRRIGPLNKLTIAALDDESIWEQLQTRNIPLLRIVDKMSKRLKARIAVKKPAVIPTCDESASDDEQSDKSERIGDAGSISGEESGDKSGSEGDFDESREDYEEMSQGSSVEDNSAATTDLNEDDRMEAWLDREDELEIDRQYRAEKRGVAPEEEDIEGPEADDLRFVQDTLYDLSDEGSDDEGDGSAAYKFSDFFVADKTDRRSASNGTKALTPKMPRKESLQKKPKEENSDDEEGDEGESMDESEPEGEEDDFQDDDEDEDEDGNSSDGDEEGSQRERDAGKPKDRGAASATPKPANRREQALTSQIAQLEGELMADKPWELRGEVKGADRPENSFLSLHADIERTSKPAPIVTQAFTSSMEDMIRRRVKEGNFSDVLPPPPRKDGDGDSAEVHELSQEKNKLGLGEVYAEDFLAKSLNAQPEAVSKRLEQDRAEAQELFHKISRQLDALSHFHFTPRPVVTDTKLRTLQPSASGVASLLLEDITPVTALSANASQLAPEQVQEKKRGKEASMMAEEELTSEDRKRKRRASKAANKAKKVRAADEAMHSGGAAAGPGAAAAKAKEENRALDEELKRDSRVTLTTASAGGKKKAGAAPSATPADNVSFSKSSSFFSKLQKETSDKIKHTSTVKGGKPKVTNPFASSANSVKL